MAQQDSSLETGRFLNGNESTSIKGLGVRGSLFGLYLLSGLIIPIYMNDICRWTGFPLEKSGFAVAVHEAICLLCQLNCLMAL